MTRPILPPDGKAYLSSVVMFELGLSSTIRDTYAALRVLAWGRAETPELTKADLEHYTGKDFQTLYRQLPVLTLNGVLRVRHVSTGLYSVVFTDGVSGAENCLKNENSQKREVAIKDSLNLKISQKPESYKGKRDSQILKNENSQKQEPPKARMKEITDEYERLVGFKVLDWAAGEGKAASQIGRQYTVDEFREAYQYYKATSFFADKRLTLRHLKTQIGEYFAAKAQGRLQGAGGASPEQLAYKRAEALRQRQARQ